MQRLQLYKQHGQWGHRVHRSRHRGDPCAAARITSRRGVGRAVSGAMRIVRPCRTCRDASLAGRESTRCSRCTQRRLPCPACLHVVGPRGAVWEQACGSQDDGPAPRKGHRYAGLRPGKLTAQTHAACVRRGCRTQREVPLALAGVEVRGLEALHARGQERRLPHIRRPPQQAVANRLLRLRDTDFGWVEAEQSDSGVVGGAAGVGHGLRQESGQQDVAHPALPCCRPEGRAGKVGGQAYDGSAAHRTLNKCPALSRGTRHVPRKTDHSQDLLLCDAVCSGRAPSRPRRPPARCPPPCPPMAHPDAEPAATQACAQLARLAHSSSSRAAGEPACRCRAGRLPRVRTPEGSGWAARCKQCSGSVAGQGACEHAVQRRVPARAVGQRWVLLKQPARGPVQRLCQGGPPLTAGGPGSA